MNLLPCPFCGGKNLSYREHGRASKADRREVVTVRCEDCWFDGPPGFGGKDAGAQEWNKRHQNSAA